MKKIFVFMIACVVFVELSHAAIVDGTCGDNLTWSLNTKDSTLTIEGSGALENFKWSQGVLNAPWYEYRSYIKVISLPDGLTSISNNAFNNCNNLKKTSIPNTVVQIGESAFESCINLSYIEIPDAVTSIGERAFMRSGIESITIPEGVESIGNGAFFDCEYLTTVYWNVINCYYDNAYSHTTGGSGPFDGCHEISTFIIGDNVQSIPSYLCAGFAYSYRHQENKLTSIDIPLSVTDIGEYAFSGCAIETIQISDRVTWLGENSFSNCGSLKSVVIGNKLPSIGSMTFYGCSNLESIVLGKNISNIGTNAFQFCQKLSKITIFASTPPSGTGSTGINPSSCRLFVPEESLEIYSNTAWWEDFKEIRAIGSLPVVKFIDWDGTLLSSVEVEEGSSATAPANPSREGYTFIGWDMDFSNVTDDMVVTALYKINRYKVDFVDWDDTLLKSDSIDWNTAAIAPTEPYRRGYTFTGWDKNFEHITSDLIIMAQYEMGEDVNVTILYTNGNNGNEILSHSVVLKMPEAPEIEGFTFLGWQPKAELINDIIEIQAIYKSDSDTAAEVIAIPSNSSQKLIRNGNVYILRDGKTYNVQGQEVK